MSTRLVLRIAAWMLLLALAIVTVGPIGLRPVTGLPPQLERALALVVVGFFFGLAYPRRVLPIGLLVVGAVVLFELVQLLEPYRHGRFADAAAKIAGAAIGLGIGHVIGRSSRETR